MAIKARKGVEAAQQASKGGSFAKTEYFSIKDGESRTVRFLTDPQDWLTLDQHQNIPTKPAPKGYSGNWPERMGAVCRRDEAFSEMYTDCYICDNIVDGVKVKKPAARQWALACIREEVIEGGKVVGYRDAIREVTRKRDGKEETFQEKAIVVVNMGFKNFFGALQAFAGHYGTLLDRDYIIKRTGKSTDTDYNIIPLDPIDTKKDDGEVGRLDLRDPELAARYQTDLDLEEIVTERSSDDFYGRFFDPRVTVESNGSSSSTPDVPKPATDAEDEAKLQELASRIKGYGDAPQEPATAGAGSGMRDFG